MTGLSERLRAAADRLPVTSGSPAELRRNVRRHRGRRRVIGGVAAGLVAVLVVVGSSLAARAARSSVESPAPAAPVTTVSTLNPSSYELIIALDRNVVLILETSVSGERPIRRAEMALQSAIAGQQGRCDSSFNCHNDSTGGPAEAELYQLNAVPTLTETDLQDFQSLSSILPATWLPRSVDAAVVPLTRCIPPPATLQATTMRATGWNAAVVGDVGTQPRWMEHLWLNEYILEFDNRPAAAAAYAGLRGQAVDCPGDPNYRMSPGDGWSTPLPDRPIESIFTAEYRRTV